MSINLSQFSRCYRHIWLWNTEPSIPLSLQIFRLLNVSAQQDKFHFSFCILYSHFSHISHLYHRVICRVVSRVAERLSQLSLSASSPLSAVSVCHVAGDDQRTGEDLVRGEEAVQMPKYCIWCLVSQPFHASHTFLSKEARKGKTRSRLVFVLHSPTQREIFMRSSSEMERTRVTRTDTHRRRGNGVCVSPCESLCACTFLSYQTWWENINMLANNRHIMGAAGNIRAWW